MAKLVAIGDSLTQGFQSGAIYRTDWSFPAIIARSMGLELPNDFRIPRFPGSGLPLNIEEALRWMKTQLGADIDLSEWIVRFPVLLGRFIDEIEDLYERGTGSRPAAFGGVYHNLGVWGFRVADSFTITPNYCQKAIENEEGWIQDDFLGLPTASMYRTALRVLNPKLRRERMDWTQLDNLKQIVNEEGVENLILWFGANDCLGTVLDLELKDMEDTNVTTDAIARRKWNLTNSQVFHHDFTQLVEKVKGIIPSDTKVFVGTVPHVTIPPVTQGIPPFDGKYFQYYGRFFAKKENFSPLLQKHLERQKIQQIDARVDSFNQSIRDIVRLQSNNWHVIDTCTILDALAVKRNEMLDAPARPLIDYYAARGLSDHPLLRLSPIPSILRLDVRDGNRYAGGLFSLDCVHPSTIGYGIVAEAFLSVMKQAGVSDTDPVRINWNEIIAHDSLLQVPPLLWENIISAAEKNSILWDIIFRVIY
ncbi:lipase [Nostoc minutum NIES-26]|uniref:Lipase n=1 Tax=Nostoc minutum NIES-26 TaxID=1844469 RepID=A0A367QQV3_9NOSO|nr:lipase [Nostoc minutum NIES-26]